MIRRSLAALVVIMCVASPAAACDPYRDDCWWREDPVPQAEPAVENVLLRQEPAAQPGWEPAPAASEPALLGPEGIYLVTEVYVADVVSVDGRLTTYSTATVTDTPGTYARVIDIVGTGTVSAYDGSAFNGRTALDDGRGVAGTYYENFVLSDGAFVPVSIVFFQDDSALAAAVRPPAPLPAPVATTEVAGVDPLIGPPPAAAPQKQEDRAPRRPVIHPRISASPAGEVGSEIEVLRGRAIQLWIRAVVDGVPLPVESWRIRSGEHTALGPSSGGGDDALTARWDVVTPPGVAWLLGVEVTLVINGVPQSSFGEVVVAVRSPALVR